MRIPLGCSEISVRHHATFWLLIPTLSSVTLSAQRAHCPRLPPQGATDRISLRAGRYQLTLAADSGAPPSSSTTGVVTLWATTPRDSSARTGIVAVGTDTSKTPFYGSVSMDFKPVHAPVMEQGGDVEPAPESRDPVYPGVLVFAGAEPVAHNSARYTILISTVSNLRDGRIVADGLGIGLWARRSVDSTFYGDWSEWGIVAGGRGHFCLTAIP
jgi:hypothetical protein